MSVNPYKELEIYSKQQMERYRGVSFYEISPHMWVTLLCRPMIIQKLHQNWSSSCCTTNLISDFYSCILRWINNELLVNRCEFSLAEIKLLFALHCTKSFFFLSAMQCLTTHTGLCALREGTSVFSYRVRVVQVKLRPPRRSSSTTQSLAPLMITWRPLVIAYCSLILYWRYLAHRATPLCISQYFMLLSEWSEIIFNTFSL